MNYDNLISQIFFNKINHIDGHKTKQLCNYPNIYDYLLHRYNDSTSIHETLFRIKYHIDKHPVCPICGKPTIYLHKYRKPFTTYCSHKCSELSNDRLEKFKQTCIKKFGTETPLASKELIEKGKKTSLSKYGTLHPFQSKVVQDKYRETCMKKYGYDWNSKTEQWKEKMSEIISSDNIQTKRYNTLKKHHTFSTSSPEEELYLYIKKKFPDVIRQYKDKTRYPFYCDFYIPSLDLLVEYNGHQSHGGHPFDNNNVNDINIVNEWKKKYDNGKHPMYMKMIDVWTYRDPMKRKIATENKLNYKEIWTLDEGKNFFDTVNF